MGWTMGKNLWRTKNSTVVSNLEDKILEGFISKKGL